MILQLTYTTGIKVQYGGYYYSALGAVPINTPPPNGLYWQPQTAVQLINSLDSSCLFCL